jgi:hypothetical protein
VLTVTLTGTLTDTSEDGVTTVSLGDVVDKLLNEHSLTDTGTTEETNLSTTSVGGDEVDDLDTSDENLGGSGLLNELGGLSVDRSVVLGLDGTTLVDGVTSDVHDTAEGGSTDGDGDGSAGVSALGTTGETLGTVHGNAADDILTEMLLLKISARFLDVLKHWCTYGNLEDELLVVVGGLERVQNGRELGGVELDCALCQQTVAPAIPS